MTTIKKTSMVPQTWYLHNQV